MGRMPQFRRLEHTPNDKRVFKIGDFVCTRVLVEMQYEHEEGAKRGVVKRHAVRVPQETEVWGQIVGACRRYEGTRYPASGGGHGHAFGLSLDPEEPDPPHFQADRQVILWEIRQGYLNKPVLAFADDIKPAIGVLRGSVPWSYQVHPKCDRRVRLELSKAARAQPRGEGGKFVKASG